MHITEMINFDFKLNSIVCTTMNTGYELEDVPKDMLVELGLKRD